MFKTGKMLTAIGDRMLATLLPTTTASAALCAGRYLGQTGTCHYYCVPAASGKDHTTKYRWCSSNRRCIVQCYDCC